VSGGQRTDPEIDGPAGARRIADGHRGTAVLRDALLGDVHPADDFDATHNTRDQLERQLANKVEHPVNANTNQGSVFERLHMHIARTAAQRLEQDRVDKLDDRRFTFGGEQVAVGLGQQTVDIKLAGASILGAFRFHRSAVLAVGGIDEAGDLIVCVLLTAQVTAQSNADIVDDGWRCAAADD
jgi:hypothetical protein